MNIDLSGINQLSKRNKEKQSTGFTIAMILGIAVFVKLLCLVVIL